jgi:apolipoprotein N-acyltransferase
MAGRIACAAVSGAALAAAFPGWNVDFLAWAALVPLLIAVRGGSAREGFVLGATCGATFFAGSTYWAVSLLQRAALPLPVAVLVAAGLCGVVAVQFGLFGAGVAGAAERGRAVWCSPVLWVALETVRSRAIPGAGWGLLGYSQYASLPIIQIASVTGVMGVSAILVAANALFAEAIANRPSWRLRALSAAVLGALLAAASGASPPSRPTDGPDAALRVAAIQVDERDVGDARVASGTRVLEAYEEMTRAAQRSGADLVVWAESAVPFFFQDPGADRDRLLALARAGSSHLLFGGMAYARPGGRPARRNRAFLVSAEGADAGFYDRRRLMPFGEYVPWRAVVPRRIRPLATSKDLTPGAEATVLRVRDSPLGVLLCYEAVFPDLARELAAAGAGLLVNLANDAWIDSGAGREQHLMHAVLRAVENRTPVVRVASGGTSAFIAADGRIRWRAPDRRDAWHVDAVSAGGGSFYTRHGDWFASSCLLLALTSLASPLLPFSYRSFRSAHGGHPGGRSLLGFIVKRGGRFSRNQATPSRTSAGFPIQ